MSTRQIMKATVLTNPGPASELNMLATVPIPAVPDGFVLVKNAFAGINYVDIYLRTGQYPIPKSTGVIIGQEAAGTIAAVSPLASSQYNLKDGDRVVWLLQGGYAEYTAVPARQVIKIPDGVKSEDAVGAFLVGLTALSLVNDAFLVKQGDKVLVHAAAGGLGLVLIQVLKQKGATVIGTAGGAEKCRLAKRFGADFMVDYRSEVNWVEEVTKLTDGKGVDVVCVFMIMMLHSLFLK